MQIDWVTFGLEIINFLVLVWILTHFLYRPVLKTLAQRRAGIERTLAEASEAGRHATALKAQFENRLADWEKEKAQVRAAFDADMAAEQARKMQALAKSLSDERERRAAQEAHRQEAVLAEMESRAANHAQKFATELLTRIAGPQVEARLADIFIEDLVAIPEEQLAGLRTAVRIAGARVTVATAFQLPEAQRNGIKEALASRLETPVPIDFTEDATLIAGVRASIGSWQLNLSLGDELSLFAAAGHVT